MSLFKSVEQSCAEQGLTSDIVSVEYNGTKFLKEQWYYHGQPVDYKRQESVAEWKQRTGTA
jgi:hypothetical protein